MPSLRPSRSKAEGGQGLTEYLLMLAAFLVILAVAVYYATLPSSEEYITIEGRITDVKVRERTTIVWENDDGLYSLTFFPTGLVLPIGENVRITYYHPGSPSSFPIIENVEVC